MAYRNIDEFLIRLEQSDELIHVPQPVDPDLEIAAITEGIAKSGRNTALWFDQVKGYDMPVVTNLFSTERRMAWALGLDSLDDLTQRLTALLDVDFSLSSLVSHAGTLMNATRTAKVLSAPVLAVQCAPDVSSLPLLRHWSQETHPTITQAQIIVRNPESNRQRVTVAPVIVQDAQTLLLPHDPTWGDGDCLSAAIILGGDPLVTWCASVPLPERINPYWLAAWLRNKPVPFIKAITQDVHVPADTEILIEGSIAPSDVQSWGICAFHDGFYTADQRMMSFKVTALSRRTNAIYPASITSHAPSDYQWMTTATERLLLPLLRLMLDEVVDVHIPAEGAFYNLAIVSINKHSAGQAQKVMFGLWGMGEFASNRAIIVVDRAVDVTDYQAVANAILHNVDWQQDCVQVQGTTRCGFGGKIGVDATSNPGHSTPIHEPVDPLLFEPLLADYNACWQFWQPGLLVVAAPDIQSVIDGVWSLCPTVNIIALEQCDLDLSQPSHVIRYALANVDWREDVQLNAQAIAIAIKSRLQPLQP